MKDKANLKSMTKSSNKMVEGLENQNGYSCLSLKVLGHSTCKLLSNHLDIPADIVTENGLTPDVFGLAELAGFDSSYVRRLASKPEKTIALLDAWSRKPDGTIGKLLTALDTLGRLDCKTDITPSIARDIKNWLQSDAKEPNQPGADIPREQPPKLKIPPATPSNKQHQDYVSSPVSPTRSTGSDPTDHNEGALTLDDLDGNQASYVACICCSDDDIEIAHTIIEAYREVTNTVQFFLPQEQLLGGKYEYESLAEVIEDRCDGRLLVIMSRTYVSSPACIFSTQFVKSLDPDAKRRKIIPIIKDEDATYPRVLRGINAIKLQRLKFSLPFWKLLSASLDIKYIPKHSQTDSSLLSPSSAGAPKSSTSYTSSSSSPSLSSSISYPSSFSGKSVPSRTFSVESLESIIDNENVSRVYGLQHQSSTTSTISNTSLSYLCQNVSSASHSSLMNGSKKDQSSQKDDCTVRLHHSKSDQGMSGMLRSSESSCSSCNPGTVKKSGRKFMSKLMKTFGLRSKSSKSLVEDPMRSSNAPSPIRSNSEPAETLQRAFKSCDDIFNDQRRDKTKLHFVQNIVTSLKTGLSGSRELTESGQNSSTESRSESLISPVSSAGDIQSSPVVELPLNIRMNTFNIIQREYSVDGNTESAILRSSGYSDTNTESAILRGAGSTESIDDNNAQFTLC